MHLVLMLAGEHATALELNDDMLIYIQIISWPASTIIKSNLAFVQNIEPCLFQALFQPHLCGALSSDGSVEATIIGLISINTLCKIGCQFENSFSMCFIMYLQRKDKRL